MNKPSILEYDSIWIWLNDCGYFHWGQSGISQELHRNQLCQHLLLLLFLFLRLLAAPRHSQTLPDFQLSESMLLRWQSSGAVPSRGGGVSSTCKRCQDEPNTQDTNRPNKLVSIESICMCIYIYVYIIIYTYTSHCILSYVFDFDCNMWCICAFEKSEQMTTGVSSDSAISALAAPNFLDVKTQSRAVDGIST